MRRKIHTQGDLDGACFLYSLANAYTALTGERPELGRWDEAISKLKWPIDFQKACVGTTDHYKKKPAQTAQDAKLVLSTITATNVALAVSACSDTKTLDGVASLIDSSSVAILWYQGNTKHVQNGNHWVCAVAAEKDPLVVHVACSIRRSDDGRFNDNQYIETEHTELKRYSNDSIAVGMDCRIMPGFVFRIENSQASRSH